MAESGKVKVRKANRSRGVTAKVMAEGGVIAEGHPSDVMGSQIVIDAYLGEPLEIDG